MLVFVGSKRNSYGICGIYEIYLGFMGLFERGASFIFNDLPVVIWYQNIDEKSNISDKLLGIRPKYQAETSKTEFPIKKCVLKYTR